LAVVAVVPRSGIVYPLAAMNWEAVWNVLKWVLAALAAGFVGQFGRVLATRIIDRRRARSAESNRPDEPRYDPAGAEDPSVARALQKLDKKRAKAEVKKAKKAGKDEP
jgi:hypothetical protein